MQSQPVHYFEITELIRSGFEQITAEGAFSVHNAPRLDMALVAPGVEHRRAHVCALGSRQRRMPKNKYVFIVHVLSACKKRKRAVAVN
jgi:hypothetical protein